MVRVPGGFHWLVPGGTSGGLGEFGWLELAGAWWVVRFV